MLRISAVLLPLVLLVSSAQAETEAPAADAIGLQAAMQSYIEANLVKGALLHIDEATGIVHSYYPAKAHPKIMQVGRFYYLCASFRDANGQDVMLNFYAAKDGNRYVFFHTLFGEDHALEARIEKHAAKLMN